VQLRPSFNSLWHRYQDKRSVAAGITDGNRCALVLGLALGPGYEPRAGEISFQQLRQPTLPFQKGVHPAIEGAEVLNRFYVRSDEMARRLIDEWGAPAKFQGSATFDAVHGKKGVIFVKNGFRTHHGGHDSHIDLWNGVQMGSWHNPDASEQTYRGLFERADEVWFWQFP
jgi:hypothetical protein